jgi:hypothetical protein
VQRVLASIQDDRTVMQGSQDNTPVGAVLPPPIRTSPIAARSQTPVPRSAPPIPQTTPAAPSMPMPSAPIQSGNNRGLYMVLGAVLLMVLLVGAATYLPNRKKASAAEAVEPPKQVQTAANATAPPAAGPVEVKPAQPAASIQQPAEPAPKQTLAKNLAPATAAPAAAQAPAQTGPTAAELDEIEHEIDQLTSRAASVNTGLDNLQRQQAAAGYGLRGDMAAKQSSMKVNLGKAQNAIAANDAVRAKRYAEMAAKDVEALERFLGR